MVVPKRVLVDLAAAALLLAGATTCQPAARAEGKAAASSTQAIGGPAVSGPPTVKPLALEDPSGVALDRFYAKLLHLQKSGRGRVRISHYGDSHVVPDVLTARVRTKLQQRFGDAGPGLALVGRPWRSYRHGEAKLGARGRWRAERLWSRYSRRRRRPRDDLFGIAGISVHTRWRGRASIEPKRGHLGAIDVYYLRQPRGGRIDVRVGNRVLRRIFTVASRKRAGYALVQLPERTRRVQLITSGGEVRLFAVDLIRSDSGVIYDALGINGAHAGSILEWNEALVADHLRRAAVDLVVLAYGSNEVDSETLTRETLAKTYDDLLARLHRVAPETDCLIVGPPSQARYSKADGWVVPEKLDFIVDEQRRMAAKHGCAFWDQRAAMGGPRAIFHWVLADPPYAQKDRVHLRWDGYLAVGEALHAALMGGFKGYRIRLAAQPDEPAAPSTSTSTRPAR